MSLWLPSFSGLFSASKVHRMIIVHSCTMGSGQNGKIQMSWWKIFISSHGLLFCCWQDMANIIICSHRSVYNAPIYSIDVKSAPSHVNMRASVRTVCSWVSACGLMCAQGKWTGTEDTVCMRERYRENHTQAFKLRHSREWERSGLQRHCPIEKKLQREHIHTYCILYSSLQCSLVWLSFYQKVISLLDTF